MLTNLCFEVEEPAPRAFYLSQLQLSQLCVLFFVLEAGRTLQVSVGHKESVSILEYRKNDKATICTRVDMLWAE